MGEFLGTLGEVLHFVLELFDLILIENVHQGHIDDVDRGETPALAAGDFAVTEDEGKYHDHHPNGGHVDR